MFLQVVVYTPDERIFYLNITLNNIVKVFRFDISPPIEELLCASQVVIRLNPDISIQKTGLHLWNKFVVKI